MGVVACFEGVRCKRWAAEGGGVRIDGQSLGQGESGEKFLAGKAEGDRQGRPRCIRFARLNPAPKQHAGIHPAKPEAVGQCIFHRHVPSLAANQVKAVGCAVRGL